MGRPPVPIAARFWLRVTKTETCWLWDGRLNADGYGAIGERVSGRLISRYVHRFAYELLVGPIPDGHEVDHTCFVRHCVNPAHLEAVTRAENVRRQRKTTRRLGGRALHQQFCRSGRHELTPDNVLARRRCRACRQEWQRAARLAGRNV